MSEEFNKILNQIAQDNGLVKYEYRCEKGTKHNEGMMSEMLFVVLEGQRGEGGLKKLNLLVKHIPNAWRNEAPFREMFLREIFIYEVVFPTFAENQVTTNNLTKCYATSKENKHEMLVFDNLCQAGYSLWPLNVPMDHSHLALVITNYARLHAYSFILKQKNLEKYKNIVQEITKPLDEVKIEAFMDLFINHSLKITQSLKPETDDVAIKKYEAFLKDLKPFMHDIYLSDSKNDDFYVILHGDCWSNNFLFKYEDQSNSKKPTDLKFIDWQLVKVHSPVVDLAYFLYCTASKELYDNYEQYKQIYYEEINLFLRKHGYEAKQLYPLEKFDEHWRKYSKYGLAVAGWMINDMLNKENLPTHEEMHKRGKNFFDYLSQVDGNKNEFHRRIRDVILHFADNNLI